jgi:putative Holliday junction resolvase
VTTIAALDFGARRIGIAVVRSDVVVPVGVIEQRSRKLAITEVTRRLVLLGADAVVVGLPLNMDGRAGPQAIAAEKFAIELRVSSGLPVELYDERLSSFEARERLLSVPGRRRRGAQVDALAACIILESWLGKRK